MVHGRRRSLLAVLPLLMGGCNTLPPLQTVPSAVMADSLPSALDDALGPAAAAHPGETGIVMLGRAREALASRLALASAAERSIDLQYFIWHDDRVGRLMLDALWQAADRGVRVRLLLDDLYTKSLDPQLVAFSAHPNAEVRLYNPWASRRWRWLDWVNDFRRMQRRMHNKSFTVDNSITIVGGRNIGNEYYGLHDEMLFADLDVAMIGAAVDEVGLQFDTYWNSRSAYPITALVDTLSDARRLAVRHRLAATREDSLSRLLVEADGAAPGIEALLSTRTPQSWATAEILYDHPSKSRTSDPKLESLLIPQLLNTVGRPTQSFDLVSPYFVPGDDGVRLMTDLVQRGVRVRVLTNSLAATDVVAVHAGYLKWRKQLLRGGVELYEFDPVASRDVEARETGRPAIGESGASMRPNRRTALSLHSKTFAMDSTRLFVGSFNFDPRSVLYNTELGAVIRSDMLARELHDDFARDVPRSAYELRLGAHGLEWLEQTPQGIVVHRREPRASLWRRFSVAVLRWLPVDLLL